MEVENKEEKGRQRKEGRERERVRGAIRCTFRLR